MHSFQCGTSHAHLSSLCLHYVSFPMMKAQLEVYFTGMILPIWILNPKLDSFDCCDLEQDLLDSDAAKPPECSRQHTNYALHASMGTMATTTNRACLKASLGYWPNLPINIPIMTVSIFHSAVQWSTSSFLLWIFCSCSLHPHRNLSQKSR